MSSITRRNALLLGAGLTLTLVAVDPLMATPAISGGMMIVRTQHSLWAIGGKK